MGAREETGCLSSPALAAAAHRLLRAACLRGPGGGDSTGTVPPGRRARHFVPAFRAPRAQGSTRPLPLKVRAAPGPLPAARSRSPGKNWRLKKKRSQEGSRWPGLGAPYFKGGRKKKQAKRKAAAWRNFCFLLLEKGLRINFLWPPRRRSFGAARTLDWLQAACARPAELKPSRPEGHAARSRRRASRAGPAPLASPARASLPLSPAGAAHLLAASLGAPALCPR